MPGVRGTIPVAGTPPQEDYPVRVAGSQAGGSGVVRTVNVDSDGHVQVDVLSEIPGSGATNLGKAEDAAHASGDVGVMALGVRRDTAVASSGTDGDYEPLSTDSLGRVRIAAAPANDAVDIGNVDVTSVISGAGATNLGKAEDAAHASGDVGVFMLGVRNDANATRTDLDTDYAPVSVDLAGNLRVVGNVDHGAADAGSPVKIGGRARTALPTAVADAQRVNEYFNEFGEPQVIAGGRTVRLLVTPTVSTTPAYTSGDAIGGLMEFTNAARKSGGSGLISKIVLVDLGADSTEIDIFFFDRTFTATADNAAYAPSDADLANSLGSVKITSGDYVAATAGVTGQTVATVRNVGLSFVLNGTSLFAQAVVRGTPTKDSTTDLQFKLEAIQD